MSELLDQLRSDVEHIRQTWLPGMDPHALRRDAAVLRRWIIDPGGAASLWRMAGHGGKLMMPEVSDLASLPHARGLEFAAAARRSLDGTVMSDVLLWRQDLCPKDLDTAWEQPRDRTLDQYAKTACLVIHEKFVRRKDLIKYVANKRGGVHHDSSRSGDPRERAAHLLLDQASEEGFRGNDVDLYLGQFMNIGHEFVSAPDVLTLCSFEKAG